LNGARPFVNYVDYFSLLEENIRDIKGNTVLLDANKESGQEVNENCTLKSRYQTAWQNYNINVANESYKKGQS
jgi:hypothetical protein